MALSAVTKEGVSDLMKAMEGALSSQMEYVSCTISYDHVTLLSTVHNMGILDEVQYLDEGVFVRGKVPLFLKEQIENRSQYDAEDKEDEEDGDLDDSMDGESDSDDKQSNDDFDWTALAKGRHTARREWDSMATGGRSDFLFPSSDSGAAVSASVGTESRKKCYTSSSNNQPLNLSRGNKNDQSLKRRKTTFVCKSDGSEEGDEFYDTTKLLDFDAGDYDGTTSAGTEDAER